MCSRWRDQCDSIPRNEEKFAKLKRKMRPSHVELKSKSLDIYVEEIKCFEARDACQLANGVGGRRIDDAVGLDLAERCVYKRGEKVTYTRTSWKYGDEFSFFLSPDAALFAPRIDHARSPLPRFVYPLPFGDSSRNRNNRVMYSASGRISTSELYCGSYRDFPRGLYQLKMCTRSNRLLPDLVEKAGERDDSELDAREAAISDRVYQAPYRPIVERIFRCSLPQ